MCSCICRHDIDETAALSDSFIQSQSGTIVKDACSSSAHRICFIPAGTSQTNRHQHPISILTIQLRLIQRCASEPESREVQGTVSNICAPPALLSAFDFAAQSMCVCVWGPMSCLGLCSLRDASMSPIVASHWWAQARERMCFIPAGRAGGGGACSTAGLPTIVDCRLLLLASVYSCVAAIFCATLRACPRRCCMVCQFSADGCVGDLIFCCILCVAPCALRFVHPIAAPLCFKMLQCC
jgi:hypothetical protein